MQDGYLARKAVIDDAGAMLRLSDDEKVARRQMCGLVYYLTAFGMVDGDYEPSEREFVRDYLRKTIETWVATTMADGDERSRQVIVDAEVERFDVICSDIERGILSLWSEALGDGNHKEDFVQTRLKVRCFEVFESFERDGQQELLRILEDLLIVDGHVHPAERKMRDELRELISTTIRGPKTLVMPAYDQAPLMPMAIEDEQVLPSDGPLPAVLEACEVPWSDDPKQLAKQLDDEIKRMRKVRNLLAEQRSHGDRLLEGVRWIGELPEGTEALDRFVYAFRPTAGRDYEVTVVGDVHGCYSCLKAVLVQSRFFEKLEAWRSDPEGNPEPRLIFLGDYVDRGRFGFEVVRGVLEILLAAPENVWVLRGNHEWYVDQEGTIIPAVRPAEGFAWLSEIGRHDLTSAYLELFDDLPHALFFDHMLFTHGGPPPDRFLKENYRSIGDLNHILIRLYMMWGDPSTVDVIPASLQEQPVVRFDYGKLQAQVFLERMGCRSMIRGHELVEEGFRTVYAEPDIHLFTLFSAGGSENDDLPEKTPYRWVSPKALTIHYRDGGFRLVPWAIDWEHFNDPSRNALLAAEE